MKKTLSIGISITLIIMGGIIYDYISFHAYEISNFLKNEPCVYTYDSKAANQLTDDYNVFKVVLTTGFNAYLICNKDQNVNPETHIIKAPTL